jgi:hypothetical protein
MHGEDLLKGPKGTEKDLNIPKRTKITYMTPMAGPHAFVEYNAGW